MSENKIKDQFDKDDLTSQYEATFISDDIPQEASDKIRKNKPDSSIDNRILLILDQRYQHRETLLQFLIRVTKITVYFFIALVAVKIYGALILDMDLISDGLLGTIAVSIFAEIIAVIRGITKALWSEKDIMGSPIIKKMHDDQHLS